MKRNFMIDVIGIVALIGTLAACQPDTSTAQPVKQSESQKAQATANSIRFTGNAEIENIKKRLELTSDPGLLGYIVLLNQAGTPVLYTAVKGKVTSSGKRLTKDWQFVRGDGGEWTKDFIVPAPSDEGTQGSSSPYIYFWTPAGQYIQWSGLYLYSDQPFRLDEEAVVVKIQQVTN